MNVLTAAIQTLPLEVRQNIRSFIKEGLCVAATKITCGGVKYACRKEIKHDDPLKEWYCSDTCKAIDKQELVIDFVVANVTRCDVGSDGKNGFLCPYCNIMFEHRVYIKDLRTSPEKMIENIRYFYEHFNMRCVENLSETHRVRMAERISDYREHRFWKCLDFGELYWDRFLKIPARSKRICSHALSSH